jgi:hypothetical protein
VGPSGTEVVVISESFSNPDNVAKAVVFGSPLRHAYVFDCLNEAGLVAKQQYQGVSRIN